MNVKHLIPTLCVTGLLAIGLGTPQTVEAKDFASFSYQASHSCKDCGHHRHHRKHRGQHHSKHGYSHRPGHSYGYCHYPKRYHRRVDDYSWPRYGYYSRHHGDGAVSFAFRYR
ncbi:MAG: hypothetical protein ACFCVA_16545 [Gammaproteobacteria bacterium]